MRKTLIGVVSSAAVAVALLASGTLAWADSDMAQQNSQGVAQGYGSPGDEGPGPYGDAGVGGPGTGKMAADNGYGGPAASNEDMADNGYGGPGYGSPGNAGPGPYSDDGGTTVADNGYWGPTGAALAGNDYWGRNPYRGYGDLGNEGPGPYSAGAGGGPGTGNVVAMNGGLVANSGGGQPSAYRMAYDPDVAPAGSWTPAGVCNLIPTRSPAGMRRVEVCR